MKFKFFFYLILYTAIFASVLYGVAQGLVEHYFTYFSFSLLVILVIGITGMMRTASDVRKVTTQKI